MDSIEEIRVGEEGAETGFGAEVDDPPFVFGVGKIYWISVVENTPTEGDELFRSLTAGGSFRHLQILQGRITSCPMKWVELRRSVLQED